MSAHSFAQTVISSTATHPTDPSHIRLDLPSRPTDSDPARYSGAVFRWTCSNLGIMSITPFLTTRSPAIINVFGTLRINASHADALMSSRAPIYAHATFLVTVTVQDIVDLIISQEYYQFDPAGSGFLFWQLALLEQYVAKGWISSDDFARIKQEVQQFAASQGPLPSRRWYLLQTSAINVCRMIPKVFVKY